MTHIGASVSLIFGSQSNCVTVCVETHSNPKECFPPLARQVLLNAAVYKGMSVTKAKKMIKFAANVGDGLTSFMVKVTADEIDDLHTRVVGLVPRS